MVSSLEIYEFFHNGLWGVGQTAANKEAAFVAKLKEIQDPSVRFSSYCEYISDINPSDFKDDHAYGTKIIELFLSCDIAGAYVKDLCLMVYPSNPKKQIDLWIGFIVIYDSLLENDKLFESNEDFLLQVFEWLESLDDEKAKCEFLIDCLIHCADHFNPIFQLTLYHVAAFFAQINERALKIQLIRTWLFCAENQVIDEEILLEIPSLLESDFDAQKLFRVLSQLPTGGRLINISREILFLACFSKIEDDQEKCDAFVECIEDGHLVSKYDAFSVASAFTDLKMNNQSISGLCKALHPHIEEEQKELFFNCMRLAKSHDVISIKAFASSLSSDDLCFEVLDKFKKDLSPHDVMEVANNRLASLYGSLAQLLDLPFLDALTEEGVATVTQLFGNLPQDTKLVSLFSYYDLYNALDDFKRIVKSEVLQKLKDEFKPSENSSYFTVNEHNKLLLLDVSPFPRANLITRYLRSKKLSVPSLQSSIASLDVHDAMQNKFKALLLKADAATQTEVIEFFEDLLGEKLPNEANRKALYDIFKNKKNALASLFCRPNGMIAYIEIIRGIDDGCIANIGTQTNIAVTSMLFEELADQILYNCFYEAIASKIINKSNDILGGSVEGLNILGAAPITGAFINPRGFMVALSSQFYHDKEIIRDPWELIRTLISSQQAQQLRHEIIAMCNLSQTALNADDLERLDELSIDWSKYNELSAKMAAYLIVREAKFPVGNYSRIFCDQTPALDAICQSEYMREITEGCERLLLDNSFAEMRLPFQTL